KPKAAYRQDATPNLGAPLKAGASLAMNQYFSQKFDNKDPATASMQPQLAKTVAGIITQFATKSMSLAIYGIDDISASMKPVYDAIVGVAKKFPVRAVFDIEGVRTYDEISAADGPALMKRTKPILFSYVIPPATDPTFADYQNDGIVGRPLWLS